MNKELELIENIKKLSLTDNDILVFKCNQHLPKLKFDTLKTNISKGMKEKFGIKKVIVLPCNIDINVNSIKDLKNE